MWICDVLVFISKQPKTFGKHGVLLFWPNRNCQNVNFFCPSVKASTHENCRKDNLRQKVDIVVDQIRGFVHVPLAKKGFVLLCLLVNVLNILQDYYWKEGFICCALEIYWVLARTLRKRWWKRLRDLAAASKFTQWVKRQTTLLKGWQNKGSQKRMFKSIEVVSQALNLNWNVVLWQHTRFVCECQMSRKWRRKQTFGQKAKVYPVLNYSVNSI